MNYTLAFYSEIEELLRVSLQNTIWLKVDMTRERSIQLIEIHKSFIDKAMSKLSGEEIAIILFKYDQNLKLF